MKKPPKKFGTWANNFGKSVRFGSENVLKEIAPATTELASNISISDIIDSIKGSKNIRDRLGSAILGEESYNRFVKYGNKAIENAKRDLKTGTLVGNPDGEDLDDSDFGLDDDFSFDTDFSSSSSTPSISKNASTSGLGADASKTSNTETTKKLGEISAAINTQTSVESSGYTALLQGFNNVGGNIVSSIHDIGTRQISVLDSMNQNLTNLVTFNNETMSKFAMSSMKFYEDSMNLFKLMSSPYQAKKDGIDKREESAYDDIFSGGFNVGAYRNQVAKNLKNVFQNSMIGTMISMLDNDMILEEMVAHPLGFVVEKGISFLVPKIIEKTTKQLDETIKEFFPALIARFTKMGKESDNPFLSTIGKILGLDESAYNSRPDLAKYEKGAVPFDGVTRKAIVEVIPTYLRKILSVMAGREEMVYNFDTGKFVSLESMKRDKKNEDRRAYLNATYDLRSEVSDFFASHVQYANDRERKDVNKELEDFWVNVGKEGLNVRKLEEYTAKGLSNEIAKIVQAVVLNASKGKQMQAMSAPLKARSEIIRRNQRLNNQNDAASISNNALYNGFETEYDIEHLEDNPDYYKVQNRTQAGSRDSYVLRSRNTNSFGRSAADVNKKFKEEVDRERASRNTNANHGAITLTDNANVDQINAIIAKDRAEREAEREGSEPKWTEKISRYFSKPQQLLVDMMHKVDNTLYDIIFGTEGSGSLLDETLTGIKRLFKKTELWLSENVFKPIKEKLFGENFKETKFYKFFSNGANKVRDSIFGVVNKRTGLSEGGLLSESFNEVKKMFGTTGEFLRSNVWGNVKKDLSTVSDRFKRYFLGEDYNKFSDGSKKKPFIDTIFETLGTGIQNFKDFFFGNKPMDDRRAAAAGQSFTHNLKARMPKAFATGIMGAGIGGVAALSGGWGLLGSLFLPGGPVGGLILGTAIGFARQSEGFKNFVFGNEETGKKGIVPQKFQNWWNKNKTAIIGGSTLGAIKGILGLTMFPGFMTILPGVGIANSLFATALGPILSGAALGLAYKSQAVQNLLFGKTDDKTGKRVSGILNNKATKKFTKVFPNMAVGAIGLNAIGLPLSQMGILGSFLFGGPLPLTIMGAAAGLAISSEKFKNMIFGYEDKDGNIHGGLADKFKNFFSVEIMMPLRMAAAKYGFKVGKWFQKDVINPLSDAFYPIKASMQMIGRSIANRVSDTFKDISNSIKDLFKPVKDNIMKLFKTVLDPIKWLMDKTVSTTFRLLRLATALVVKPISLMGNIASAGVRGITWKNSIKGSFSNAKNTMLDTNASFTDRLNALAGIGTSIFKPGTVLRNDPIAGPLMMARDRARVRDAQQKKQWKDREKELKNIQKEVKAVQEYYRKRGYVSSDDEIRADLEKRKKRSQEYGKIESKDPVVKSIQYGNLKQDEAVRLADVTADSTQKIANTTANIYSLLVDRFLMSKEQRKARDIAKRDAKDFKNFWDEMSTNNIVLSGDTQDNNLLAVNKYLVSQGLLKESDIYDENGNVKNRRGLTSNIQGYLKTKRAEADAKKQNTPSVTLDDAGNQLVASTNANSDVGGNGSSKSKSQVGQLNDQTLRKQQKEESYRSAILGANETIADRLDVLVNGRGSSLKNGIFGVIRSSAGFMNNIISGIWGLGTSVVDIASKILGPIGMAGGLFALYKTVTGQDGELGAGIGQDSRNERFLRKQTEFGIRLAGQGTKFIGDSILATAKYYESHKTVFDKMASGAVDALKLGVKTASNFKTGAVNYLSKKLPSTNVAESIFSKARQVFTNTMKNKTPEMATGAGRGMIVKMLAAVENGLKHPLVKKYLGDKWIVKARDIMTKLVKRIADPRVWSKVLTLSTAKLAGKSLRVIGGAMTGGVLTAAFAVYDGVTGISNADQLFRVPSDKVTMGMRAISAFINIVMGLPLPPIIAIDLGCTVICQLMGLKIDHRTWLATELYKAIASEEDAKELEQYQQDAMDAYQAYLDENNLTEDQMTFQQYLDKTQGEGFFTSIVNKTTQAFKKLGNMIWEDNDDGSLKSVFGSTSLAATISSIGARLSGFMNGLLDFLSGDWNPSEWWGNIWGSDTLKPMREKMQEISDYFGEKYDGIKNGIDGVISKFQNWVGTESPDSDVPKPTFSGGADDVGAINFDNTTGHRQTVMINESDNGMSYYSQDDENWKDAPLAPNVESASGITLGEAGCGPTSMAMVVSQMQNKEFTPVDASKYVTEADLPEDGWFGRKNRGIIGHQDSDDYFTRVARSQDMSAEKIDLGNREQFMTAMYSGTPVIIGGETTQYDKYSPFYTSDRDSSDAGHYVVVSGLDPENPDYAYVYNPSGSLSSASNGNFRYREISVDTLFNSDIKYMKLFKNGAQNILGSNNEDLKKLADRLYRQYPDPCFTVASGVDVNGLSQGTMQCLQVLTKYYYSLKKEKLVVTRAYDTSDPVYATRNVFNLAAPKDSNVLESNDGDCRTKLINTATRYGANVKDKYNEPGLKEPPYIQIDAVNWGSGKKGRGPSTTKSKKLSILDAITKIGTFAKDWLMAKINGENLTWDMWKAQTDGGSTSKELDLSDEEINKNRKLVWDTLVNEYGFSRKVASAIMGSIEQESHFNPTAIGDGGTSEGIVQWHLSRRDELRQFAEEQGQPYTDIKTQLDFLKSELDGKYSGVVDNMESAGSLYDATKVFIEQFENPADPEGEVPQRYSYAKIFYDDNKEFTGGSGFVGGGLLDTIKEGASNLWQGAKDKASEAVDYVSNKVSGIFTSNNTSSDNSDSSSSSILDNIKAGNALAGKSTTASFMGIQKLLKGTFGSNSNDEGSDYYSQQDARWAQAPLAPNADPSYGTIGKLGCAPTAMAMVVSQLNHNGFNPLSAAESVTSSDLNSDGTGITVNGNNDYFSRVAEEQGINYRKIDNANDIVSAIKSNNPVILGGSSDDENSIFYGDGHFVLANGVSKSDSNKVKILNPAGRNIEMDISELLSQISGNGFAAEFSNNGLGNDGSSLGLDANDPCFDVYTDKTLKDINTLTPKSKAALRFVAQYYKLTTGRNIVVMKVISKSIFEIKDDPTHNTLEADKNGFKKSFIRACNRVGIRVDDRYNTRSGIPCLRLDVSGFKGSSLMILSEAKRDYFFDPEISAAEQMNASHSIGSGGITALSGNSNAQKVWNYLMAQGFTRVAASGIMGNFDQESTFNPDVWDPGHQFYGLAQWGMTRLERLHTFAAQNGADPSDLSTQLAYFMWECNNDPTYSNTIPALQAATTPGEATEAFIREFERPTSYAEEARIRTPKAEAYFNDTAGFAGGRNGEPYADYFINEGDTPMPYYNQNDDRWKLKPLTYEDPGLGTIGDLGCAPTSAAMVVSLLKGAAFDPEDAAAHINPEDVDPMQGIKADSGYFTRIAERVGMYAENLDNGEEIKEKAFNGLPMIIGGRSMDPSSPFYGDGHYAVVAGVDSNNNDYALVYDPDGTPKDWSFERLNKEFKVGWAYANPPSGAGSANEKAASKADAKANGGKGNKPKTGMSAMTDKLSAMVKSYTMAKLGGKDWSYKQFLSEYNSGGNGNSGGGDSGNGITLTNVDGMSGYYYLDPTDWGQASWDKMQPRTKDFMNKLTARFYKDSNVKVHVSSGWRGTNYGSYHESGMAFDVWADEFENNQALRRKYVAIGEAMGGRGLDEYPGEPGAVYASGNNIHFTVPESYAGAGHGFAGAGVGDYRQGGRSSTGYKTGQLIGHIFIEEDYDPKKTTGPVDNPFSRVTTKLPYEVKDRSLPDGTNATIKDSWHEQNVTGILPDNSGSKSTSSNKNTDTTKAANATGSKEATKEADIKFINNKKELKAAGYDFRTLRKDPTFKRFNKMDSSLRKVGKAVKKFKPRNIGDGRVTKNISSIMSNNYGEKANSVKLLEGNPNSVIADKLKELKMNSADVKKASIDLSTTLTRSDSIKDRVKGYTENQEDYVVNKYKNTSFGKSVLKAAETETEGEQISRRSKLRKYLPNNTEPVVEPGELGQNLANKWMDRAGKDITKDLSGFSGGSRGRKRKSKSFAGGASLSNAISGIKNVFSKAKATKSLDVSALKAKLADEEGGVVLMNNNNYEDNFIRGTYNTSNMGYSIDSSNREIIAALRSLDIKADVREMIEYLKVISKNGGGMKIDEAALARAIRKARQDSYKPSNYNYQQQQAERNIPQMGGSVEDRVNPSSTSAKAKTDNNKLNEAMKISTGAPLREYHN